MNYIIQYQENSHLFLSLFSTKKKSDKGKTIEVPWHSGKNMGFGILQKIYTHHFKNNNNDDNNNNHYLLRTYYEPKQD